MRFTSLRVIRLAALLGPRDNRLLPPLESSIHSIENFVPSVRRAVGNASAPSQNTVDADDVVGAERPNEVVWSDEQGSRRLCWVGEGVVRVFGEVGVEVRGDQLV